MSLKTPLSINLLSYNIHKGFSFGNTQYTLELIKKGIQESGAELLCLQEVCGPNMHTHKEKLHPLHTQFEYLADGSWPHFAYGKNAVYKKGHHGNAILSKYPIVDWHNLDLSTNRFEKRGLLHAKLELPNEKFLHVMTAHLDLFEKGRKKQCQKIISYIADNVDPKEALLLAGDFNDWRQSLSKHYLRECGLDEVFMSLHQSHAKSFPSLAPFLKLDRIYFRQLKAVHARCFSGDPWNKLSDHSPLYAEFEV